MLECLNESVLLEYVRGRTNDEFSREIEEHLEECTFCNTTTTRLERQAAALLKRPADLKVADDFDVEAGADIARRLAMNVESVLLNHPNSLADSNVWRQLQPGDQLDDFVILGLLGSGGFSVVYLAQQKSMQRTVALKVSEQRSHEAPVLSNLDHPHIVRVYDERDVPDKGIRLLYMQPVGGGSLKQAISALRQLKPENRTGHQYLEVIGRRVDRHEDAVIFQNKSLQTADWISTVCWIGARIADALSYAHEKGVFHRDIKPANILLTPDGRPMLADFNLSFGSEVDGARPEDVFGGTIDYMSPEQIQVCLHEKDACSVGPASDLYSLGVVLSELLTGQLPFLDDRMNSNRTLQLRRTLERRMQGPSSLTLPAKTSIVLGQTIQELLAVDASLRPTAEALARVLQLEATTETRELLNAEPQSWYGTFRRWPISTLLFFSLPPNVIISVVNIYWNHEYFFRGSDIAKKSLESWEPPVNLVAFLLGIGLPLLRGTPMFRQFAGRRAGRVPTNRELRNAIELGLALPAYVWLLCLLLWIGTGIAFPILIASDTGENSTSTIVNFFCSQLTHGVIASSITFLIVSFTITRILIPDLLRITPFPELKANLDQLNRRVRFHVAALGLTPTIGVILFAYLSMGSFETNHPPSLYFSLSIFGAIGFSLALLMSPLIRSTVRTLQFITESTMRRLYGTD